MGIILVYDCTDQQTFNNISTWLKQIDQHANSNVAKVLVANKCDRPDRAVETEKGRALAEAHGLTFFETSAKNGQNVNEVFHSIARVIVSEKLPQQVQPPGGLAAAPQGGHQSLRMGPGGQSKQEVKKEKGGCC